MTNPWLSHVAKVRNKYPDLSYKEVLMKAKTTYKKQAGGGKAEVIASLAKPVAEVVGGISSDIFAQANTSLARHRRQAKQFKHLKKQMAKGFFPKMSDKQLLEYVSSTANA